MTIVESTRPVTGGVDTHADVHVAAAVDANGGVLGVESFATTPAGFAELHGWLTGFGAVARVGVEGRRIQLGERRAFGAHGAVGDLVSVRHDDLLLPRAAAVSYTHLTLPTIYSV